MAFHRAHGVSTRIMRIFNTYGPRMAPDDGRVITNYLTQALDGKPLTVYGVGSQTRSFQFVSDLIEGIRRLMEREIHLPVNLGNPEEFTMLELAEVVRRITGSESPIVHQPLPEDDPRQRRPDIARALEILGWRPTVSLSEGILKTVAHLRSGRVSAVQHHQHQHPHQPLQVLPRSPLAASSPLIAPSAARASGSPDGLGASTRVG
jgi:nucleoside-diphosphate-sugar epimerase